MSGTHSHIHAHHPGHPQDHGHGDVASANEEHFDKHAHTYDDTPGATEASRRLAAAMRKLHAFDEERTTVLDYACGTGAISRELAQHAKRIIGVDISQGMVDVYNTRVANQGIPPEEMRALRCELKGVPGELDGEKYEVVTCAMAYHHFSSIEETTRILASFLQPGGVLLVADIVASPSEGGQSEMLIPEKFHHAVPHRFGFDEATMRATFEGAGLVDFTFTEATKAKMPNSEKDVKLFVAKGVAPSAA